MAPVLFLSFAVAILGGFHWLSVTWQTVGQDLSTTRAQSTGNSQRKLPLKATLNDQNETGAK